MAAITRLDLGNTESLTSEFAVFLDRHDAGRRLAAETSHLAGPDTMVVGLPRGGVPVAFEVAKALGAPLDVILVRKLGVPFQPELAMGAIGEHGVLVTNPFVVERAGVSAREFAAVQARERAELDRRAADYGRHRGVRRLAGRQVIVVDDGVATGSTASAACQVARAAGARRVVLAVPVAPADWSDRLAEVADELIAVATPANLLGVGRHYRDFTQVTDDEVIDCLRVATEAATDGADPPLSQERAT